MNFQNRIYYLRTEHHLSQTELARLLGVTRQTISRWETGVSYPELNKLPLLCRVLHTTPSDLCAPPCEEKPPVTTDEVTVNEIDPARFSDRIRAYRTQAGYSQEALGEKLNVTRQTISRWETAQMLPDMDKLLQLLPLLQIDADTLLAHDVPSEKTDLSEQDEKESQSEDPLPIFPEESNAPKEQPPVADKEEQPKVAKKKLSRQTVLLCALSIFLFLTLLLGGCVLYALEKNTPQICDVFSLNPDDDLLDARLSHEDKTVTLFLAEACESFDLGKVISLTNNAAWQCEGFGDTSAIALSRGEKKSGRLIVSLGHRKCRYDLLISRQQLHTVSFERSDEVFKVADGEFCPRPAFTAAKNKFSFEGWDFAFESTPITADTHITAHWTALYTVSFEGCVSTQTVKDGAHASLPDEIPVKEGFAFAGWDHRFDTPITADTHISAIWLPTATLCPNGGYVDSTVLVLENGSEMPETPSRPGYTFGGWFTDAALTKPLGNKVEPHATLYAYWTEEARASYFTYEYNEEKNGVILQGITKDCPESCLVIPAYLGGLPVLRIEAFANAPEAIVIPATVKTVGIMAFYNCRTLQSVTFNGERTVIGDRAFAGCTALKDVQLPANLTLIDSRTFQNCTSLESLTIPKSVLAIREYAFAGCSALSSVDLSHLSLDDLDGYLFKDCTSLTRVTLGQGTNEVVNAAQNLFDGCTALKEITLPEGITVLPNAFFTGCTALERVTLPQSLVTIGSNAFRGCTSLSSVNLPDNLQTIDTGGFYGCASLKELSLPHSNLRLAKGAFENCTGLVTLTFSTSFSSIGDGAFKGCSALKAIALPASCSYLGQNLFENCTALETITIPQNWKTLPEGFFKGCSSLKNVTLPATLETIEAYAFADCSSLTALALPRGVNAPTNAFSGCEKLTLVSQ